jgi:hypothetical protein
MVSTAEMRIGTKSRRLRHALAPVVDGLELRHPLAASFFVFLRFFFLSGVFDFGLVRFGCAVGVSHFGGLQLSNSFFGGPFGRRL